MSTGPDVATPGRPDDSIGRALARLRRRRGLSGQTLGTMARLSQSKISRIETGQVLPSVTDVESILRALGEPEDVVEDFRTRARNALDSADEDGQEVLIGRFQNTYAEYERDAKTLRLFQPTLVPGLLQTSEYARSLIKRSCQVQEIDYDVEGAQAVADRVRRHKIIYDASKTFTFVAMERVLTYQVASPATMIEQLDLLKDVAAFPNVTLRIVPEGTDILLPPGGSVEMFDEKQALYETLLGIQPSTHPEEINRLIKILDYLTSIATGDVEKIIDRHRRTYVDQLRNPR